jgi:hypothetical protein
MVMHTIATYLAALHPALEGLSIEQTVTALAARYDEPPSWEEIYADVQTWTADAAADPEHAAPIEGAPVAAERMAADLIYDAVCSRWAE